MKFKAIVGIVTLIFISGCVSRHYSKYVLVEGKASLEVRYAIAQDTVLYLASRVILSKVGKELSEEARKGISNIAFRVEKGADIRIQIRTLLKKGKEKEADELVSAFVAEANKEITYRLSKVGLGLYLAEEQPKEGYRLAYVGDPAEEIYIAETPALTREDILDAAVVQYPNGPQVGITLTNAGTEKLKWVTRKNMGKKLAIVINGRVVSAPRIEQEISIPRLEVTGSFTKEQAEILAQIMRTDPS